MSLFSYHAARSQIDETRNEHRFFLVADTKKESGGCCMDSAVVGVRCLCVYVSFFCVYVCVRVCACVFLCIVGMCSVVSEIWGVMRVSICRRTRHTPVRPTDR